MKFTRPDPQNPFHSLASITANEEVSELLLNELAHSEWGGRLVAIGDVPGFLLELTIELGATSIFEAVQEDLRLNAWFEEALDKITKELYASS